MEYVIGLIVVGAVACFVGDRLRKKAQAKKGSAPSKPRAPSSNK